MLFNSFHYFVFFILVLLFLDTVRRKEFQHSFLLIASYYFYWAFSASYVLVLVLSTLIAFYSGKAIVEVASPRWRKSWLIVGLVGQLGLLGYFKYTNFAISGFTSFLSSIGFESATPHLNIILPVGISFYTFMAIGYIVDVYLGRFQPVDSLKTFALYLSFFPHLVAGPILRAPEFLPQLRRTLTLSAENIRTGFTLILIGLLKKIIIADNLSGFVQKTFNGDLTQDSLVVFIGIVAFAVQIYCDFSGYTDIAIGSARVLGLEFPGNFAHPYFATNITEFWQRWHISLSTWLRDYVYFPLGGNRRNKSRRYISLLLTMAICGLWHGASWNFLIWGIYQGVLLVAHRSLFFENGFMNDSRWNPVKILATFYLTCIGWLIFIIPDPPKLIFYIKKMLFWDLQSSGLNSLLNGYPKVMVVLSIFIVAHLISYWAKDLVQTLASLRPASWAVCMTIGAIGLFFLAASTQQSFIYFQF